MSEQLREFLGSELVSLYADGEKLLVSASGGFNDYSFVIFPFAKVYEGFLKKLFFKLGAITKQQYLSDHWRIGKALNPQLEKELRHNESVYDRIVETCGGVDLAEQLWQAWKKGRNKIFHYFPEHYQSISLEEVKIIVNELNQAMEKALESCIISNHGNNSN